MRCGARTSAGSTGLRSRTREYVENNYWHRPIEEQNADLVPVNAFWRDYAAARGRQPFVSAHFAEATGSFAEMMLALAVLDLPFEAGEHETEADGERASRCGRQPAAAGAQGDRGGPAPAADAALSWSARTSSGSTTATASRATSAATSSSPTSSWSASPTAARWW